MATDESKGELHDGFDEAHSRLFVSCRNPASVVVVDSKTGREVLHSPSGGETDCIFYDGKHSGYMPPGPKVRSTLGASGR